MSINCLVLTPFSDRDLILRESLKDILSNAGIRVMHAADLPSGISLFDGVLELLEKADVLVADISGLNSNIIYEIGLAQGAGLPVILLADQEAEVPISLSTMSLLRYEKDNLDDERLFSELPATIKKSAMSPHISKPHQAIIKAKERVKPHFESPFMYLAAEMMNDTNILEQLFVSPPYYDLVFGPETVVIVGPRGCGKTTILKMIRLQFTKDLAPGITEDRPCTAGFYMNFNQAFNFLGDRISIQAKGENAITYFNLLFLKAVLNETVALLRLGKTQKRDEFSILSAIKHSIGFAESELFSIHDLSMKIKRWTELVRSGQVLEKAIGAKLADLMFLEDLASKLINRTETFRNNRIAYLLDDYAVDLFPENIWQSLNKIVFHRSAYYSFKIATIPGRQNFSLGDFYNAESARDYILINTSTDVSFTNINSRTSFLKDILNKRLKLAGWPIDSQYLLSGKRSTRQKIDYSGLDGLSRLCSGDYASIIQICARMVSGTQLKDFPISQEIQNHIIREHSREIIQNLKSGLEWSGYVVEFVNSMMSFFKKSLSKKQNEIRQHKGRQRNFAGFLIENVNALSPGAKDRLLLLIRTGIIMPAKIAENKQHFNIKRLLFPAFDLPIYGRSDYISLNPHSCEFLLASPERFWHEKYPELLPAYTNILRLF